MITEKLLDWDDYLAAITRLVRSLKGQKFDVIVGLARGGLIPAVMASHELDTSMMSFDPHLLHVNGSPRDKIVLSISPAVTRRILIIDDISDSGKTFKKTVEFFTKRGFSITTAAVYTNREKTMFKPDFYEENVTEWIIFPYEKENNKS